MNIKHHLFFILILCISHIGLAADYESNRADRTFLVVVSPYGLAKEIHDPIPVTIGFFLKNNVSLGIQIGNVNTEYQPGKSDQEVAYSKDQEVAYSNLGIVARFFSGSSLNFIAAVHQRAWERTLRVLVEEAYAEAGVKATSTVASIGIAHQWVTDFGFVWGLDWIISSIALSSSYSISHINNQGLTESQIQILRGVSREIADTVNRVSLAPAVFVVNIGWSF